MKENIGMIDRMIRFVVAIIFIILGFVYSPWWFIGAAIALFTALIGWCALYALLGWSTNKPAETKPKKLGKKARKKK